MAKVIVYTKGRCPYCEMAKIALKQRSIPYQEVSLDGAGPDLQARFYTDTNGARTVPQIIAGGWPIGGWSDLQRLIDTPKFQQMIGGS